MSDTKLTTGLVRFAFLKIWEPEVDKDDPGKKFYKACLMIPKKDKATIKKIEEATMAAATAKWGSKVPKNIKKPLKDGDEDQDLDKYPEFEGFMYLNCKCKRQPGIIDAKREEILDEEEVYSGAWGKASIDTYVFDRADGKGVAVWLNALQKLKDDERLSGGGWSVDEFEDEDEDDI